MSAGASGAVGPVSVRYAAQIRELLFAQAVQRMAAEQEAARASASAERDARAEAASTEPSHPINAKVEAARPVDTPAHAVAPDAKADGQATGQLVDIQA